MSLRRLFLSILYLACNGTVLTAQSAEGDFSNSMHHRFKESENQWMVQGLLQINPRLFDADFELPPIWDTLTHLQLGAYQWQLTSENLKQIHDLWMPNGTNQRIAIIASLLDVYQPLFRAVCTNEGLPFEFQWIPVLSSGVNAHYVGADGRHGLWGLDYLNGRKANLNINDDIDERCGGDFTAKSVAKLLKSNMEIYKDPLKVLLIYLHGAPAVNNVNFSVFENLPKDWQLEVSFLVYTAKVFPTLRLENRQAQYFDLFLAYSPIRPKDTVTVASLEGLLKEDLKNLRGMNPTLKSDRLLPGVLKVPYYISTTNAERWSFMEDSLLSWSPEKIKEPAIEASTRHVVKRGESLGSIAKRYKTTVRSLQSENQIKGQVIRIGQVLRIPNRKSAPRQIEKPEEPQKPKQQPTPTPESKEILYTVKSGDSLWKIARKYKGVSEADIKRWNNCGDRIRPGQKLIIKL